MEDSKSPEQPLCPCGFYGSAKTQGLCSKCYKAHLDKSKEALKSTPDHMIPKTESPHVTVNYQGASSSKQDSTFLKEQELSNICVTNSSSSEKSENNQSISSSSSSTPADIAGPSPEKKGSKRYEIRNLSKIWQDEESAESTVTRDISNVDMDSTPESTPEKQSQKVKKRCFHCKCKLELAQRQIGRCKCDNVFCALHRLPELHNCDFDHKEDGRREAREKMVKPVRHLGTSFKRLDTDT